ncbi:Asp-tRNA(Asn)/Glu-tRNA(Gln) amidotransferase subunit GatA [Patescibacteria group bacterium]|nr:Asp-tRNA(Asn)/Glu-tRNA(Gln) amidotransferase subunit GatA [Patescibacteria group bacterium]MBU1922256.1 Asp-tRNA(Asn)/Glu-tRNA(Gln) amidotransferase subunit GatA [Patescibacteria group bacterium]
MQANELNLQQAHKDLRAKKISAQELVDACLEAIKKKDKKLSAFLHVFESEARELAKRADEKISRGQEIGLLEGMPIAVKDNILYAGHVCTAGSKILENYNAVYDAAVVAKLKQAGAIILGKTNMDEFAMGSSTENSAFGATKNPWDMKRVPGGSSGGSAAAVAADMCLAALGTDTGGSVRQPAALCGVVGLKPTYGRVSRYGLIAMASSLDQAGPVAKTVQDAAWLLRAIEGLDAKDSTSVNTESISTEFPQDIKNMKIGVPKQFFTSGLNSGVEKTVRQAIAKLEELGAKIIDIELPHAEYALAVYYIIMPSEVSSNLSRYDGVRYGKREKGKDLIDVYKNTRAKNLGPEVRRRVMLGAHALSSGYYEAYYGRAQRVRTKICQDFKDAFTKVDCIVGPTTPTTAFKIGEKCDDPLTMYLSDIYTVSANVAGIPAISIPAGLSGGLPVGLQFMGNYFDEKTILQIANTFELATEHHKKKPEI